MSTRSCAFKLFAAMSALVAAAAGTEAVEPKRAAVTDGSCAPDPSTWKRDLVVATTEHAVDGGARVESCLG